MFDCHSFVFFAILQPIQTFSVVLPSLVWLYCTISLSQEERSFGWVYVAEISFGAVISKTIVPYYFTNSLSSLSLSL